MWNGWDDALLARTDPTKFLADAKWDLDPIQIANRVIALRTQVNPMAGKAPARPLIVQGAALTRLFTVATCGSAASLAPSLVSAGAPILLIECRSHWLRKLPAGFAVIKGHTPPKLAYGQLRGDWGSVGVWFVGIDGATVSEARSMRLCLLRLHAEQEALSLVLDGLSAGHITYSAEDDSGRRLEGYFNEATRIVFRKKWAGIDQSAILKAFDAVGSPVAFSQRDYLAQKLEGARRQVVAKLKDFAHRPYVSTTRMISIRDQAQYIEAQEVQMNDNSVNINAPITNSILNIQATLSQVSQSLNAMPHGNDDDKKELATLIQALRIQLEAIAKTRPDEAVAIADQSKAVVDQASKNPPNKTSLTISRDGLMSAARTVADLAPTLMDTAASIAKWVTRLLL